MLAVLDRPFTTDRVGAVPVPPCPAWCNQDPDWHTPDAAMHDSDFVVVATGDQGCSRHDEGRHADEVWLALECEDNPGRGEPRLYLAPTSVDARLGSEEAHLSLDAAEDLAYEVLRLVALARGSKRARDVVVGDRIVWNGVEQVVVIALADSECCCCGGTCAGLDDCPGSYAFQTVESGDGNWLGGDLAFAPGDLVPVRVPEVTR